MRRNGRIQSDSMLNVHSKWPPRRMLQIFQKALKSEREWKKVRERVKVARVRDGEKQGEGSGEGKAAMCSILQVCALFPLRLINCAVTWRCYPCRGRSAYSAGGQRRRQKGLARGKLQMANWATARSEVVVAVPAFGLVGCSGSWHLPLVVVAKRSSGQLPATARVAAAAPQTVEQHH